MTRRREPSPPAPSPNFGVIKRYHGSRIMLRITLPPRGPVDIAVLTQSAVIPQE
jgi:hypothetical protein